MYEIALSPEQEAQAAKIEDILKAKMAVEVKFISRLLASKENGQLFGETEYQVRDAVHRVGAAGFDAALEERKKGGTHIPAVSVPTAATTRSSRTTGTAKSSR
jgi:hypothetical protein